jgi:hypothetical protein
MVHRSFRAARMTALVAVAATMLAWAAAPSWAAGNGDEDVPSTSIVPAEGPSGGPTVSAPPSSGVPPEPSEEGVTAVPAPRHHASSMSARAPAIEPAAARLKVLEAAPVYSAPTKRARKIEQLTPEKFVEVTGSTHYYLQVKLKSGETGYIDPSAVELIKPADKVFVLTHDAGVLDKPNRWAKKLAEVHQGHNVHVIGISLNYMQIRMKSGLEGFITTSALE